MITMEDIYRDLPIMETDRLLLRRLRLEDKEDLYKYASNKDVSKYVTWDPHASITDTMGYIHFIEKQYDHHRIAPWGIEHKEKRQLIGTVDFVDWQPIHRTAEIGYVISHEYWGQGIATEAASELISFGFKKMDLIRIQARCVEENRPSRRVMEKCGMLYEGTLRKGMTLNQVPSNICIYSILKEEYESKEKIEDKKQ
ncbi:MAG: GNAT family N-acetyltransferase [Bacillus sp. (in: firmicutes)]